MTKNLSFSIRVCRKTCLNMPENENFLKDSIHLMWLYFFKCFSLSVTLLQWSSFWRMPYWTTLFNWKPGHEDRAIVKITDHKNSRAKTCFVTRAVTSYSEYFGVLQYPWLLSFDMLHLFVHKKLIIVKKWKHKVSFLVRIFKSSHGSV